MSTHALRLRIAVWAIIMLVLITVACYNLQVPFDGQIVSASGFFMAMILGSIIVAGVVTVVRCTQRALSVFSAFVLGIVLILVALGGDSDNFAASGPAALVAIPVIGMSSLRDKLKS